MLIYIEHHHANDQFKIRDDFNRWDIFEVMGGDLEPDRLLATVYRRDLLVEILGSLDGEIASCSDWGPDAQTTRALVMTRRTHGPSTAAERDPQPIPAGMACHMCGGIDAHKPSCRGAGR